MSLGPGRLVAAHAALITKNRILINRYYSTLIEWKSPELSELKAALRLSLRHQQQGRCFYCRRVIKVERKNTSEDIEHFLDKSKAKYRKWAFSPVNLAIACHPCNFQKSTKDMGDNGISTASKITTLAGEYTWLHPYFDDYFENIEIEDGWFYKVKVGAPKPRRARNLIAHCALDSIRSTEKIGLDLSKRKSRLLVMVAYYMTRDPVKSARFLRHVAMLESEGWKYL